MASANNVNITIAADSKQAQISVRQLNDELTKATDSVRKFADTARQTSSAYDALQNEFVNAATAARRLDTASDQAATAIKTQASATKEAKEATQKHTKSAEAAVRAQEELAQKTNKAKSSFGGLSTAIKGMVAAFGVSQIADFARNIFGLEKNIKATEKAFVQITGSAEAAKAEFDFLREVADKTGQNFYDLTDSYKGLLAASRDTNLAGAQTRKIFESVTKASASLGLSSEQTQGALYALSQMISKGNVQTEELRGQLGERLPGAFNLAAEAMGVSTQELNKMLEQGQVAADVMLPKLADVLANKFTGEVDESVRASNKFSEAWTNLKREFANSGFMTSASEALNKLSASFKDPAMKQAMADLGSNLGKIVSALASAVPKIVNFVSEWGKSIAVAYGVSKAFAAIKTALDGVSTAWDTLRSKKVLDWLDTAKAKVSGLTGAFGLLSKAMSVAGAFVAGWEIGKVLSEKFEVVRKSGISLAAGMTEVFERLRYGWEMFRAATSGSWESFDQITKQHESRLKQIQDIYTDMFTEASDAAIASQKAQEKAAKETADAHEKAAEKTKASQEKVANSLTATTGKVSELSDAMSDLGLDLEKFTTGMTTAEAKAIQSFESIGKSAQSSNDMITAALEATAKKMTSLEGIDHLKAKYLELEATGKLSAKHVADALDLLDKKTRELSAPVDEVAAAYERLGVEISGNLDAAKWQALKDFDTIRFSGKATTEELAQAFKAYSSKAIAAAKKHGEAEVKVQQSMLDSMAASAGLTDQLAQAGDEGVKAGEKISQSFEGAAQSIKGAATEMKKAADASKEAATAQENAAKRWNNRYGAKKEGVKYGKTVYGGDDEATEAAYSLKNGLFGLSFSQDLFDDFEALRKQVESGESIDADVAKNVQQRLEKAVTEINERFVGAGGVGGLEETETLMRGMDEILRSIKKSSATTNVRNQQSSQQKSPQSTPAKAATTTTPSPKKVTLEFRAPSGQTVEGDFEESQLDALLDLLRQAGLTASV